MWIFKKNTWPIIPKHELIKRTRILVIDDAEFPYKELFERDGYSVDKWDDVKELAKLEKGDYDIILLDVQGIGKEYSAEQGLGVLKHLKIVSPAQIIISYSSGDYSLKHQDSFRLADYVLSKTSDFTEFKQVVDQQIERRASYEYYLEKIRLELKGRIENEKEFNRAAHKAIIKGDSRKLMEIVSKWASDNAVIGQRIEAILSVAANLLSIYSGLSK